MIMAIGLLAVSKIGGDQMSDGPGHKEMDCNSLKCNLGLYVLLNLNVGYILNRLP